MLDFLRRLVNSKYKIPDNLKFKPYQKVFCMVTHEVRDSKVCNGYVIGYAFKKASYWAFSEVPSNWYNVRYEDGTKVCLPEERIKDLEEYVTKTKRFLALPHCVNDTSEAKYKMIAEIIAAEQYLQ